MRALLQRVTQAGVQVSGGSSARIGAGIVILLGITHADDAAHADVLAGRCANLRIFEDADVKMNRSLLHIAGSALVVSQFTLYGDTRKGRRPSFIDAARPEQAEPLYEAFVAALRALGIRVETGTFGAEMQVDIRNDGPVTLMLET